MKKISLVELLGRKPTDVVNLKIASENVTVGVLDIGVFENTSLAYIDTPSMFRVLPQHELWFNLKK